MILVTGASGFLGQQLVKDLSGKGMKVRALYHSHPPTPDNLALPGVIWQAADLLDIFDVTEALEDIEDVYHCAAIVSFDPRLHQKMLHFNPESTANVVNQCVKSDVRKLVHISSIAAIGRSGSGTKNITEEEEWGESSYSSAYGMSKHLAEMEVWRGIGEGLTAVVLNPAIILGNGGFDQGTPALMELAWRQFPFYPSGVNGWVDVKDVTKAAMALMEAPIVGERFIICEGNHSYQEVLSLIASALGRKSPTIETGKSILALAPLISKVCNFFKIGGVASGITSETARTASEKHYYDSSKLLSALPDFKYTPLTATLFDIAQKWRASRDSEIKK